MSEHHITLSFHGKAVSRVIRFSAGSEPVAWLYLGKDFFKRRFIEEKLGSRFRRIDIAKLHAEVAQDIREEHVMWIDKMNRQYGEDLEWWFAPIASRDIYSSNLFQNCIYLEILERLRATQTDMPKLIVVESLGLLKAIIKWALQNDIGIKVARGYAAELTVLSNYIAFSLRWVSFIIILFSRYAAAFTSRIKGKSKKLKMPSYVILNTFIHNDSLSPDGKLKDRYFPYLHEYLQENGLQVLVHPVLYGFRFNYFSIYKRMRRSDTHFIIPEDFLQLEDLMTAITYPLRALRRKIKAAPFRYFDVSDLLSEELRRQTVTSAMQALLIYHVILRFGKTGLPPELIIDWYENQSVDKAFIAGCRKVFPNAKIIGAQIYISSQNCLNLFPSQAEVDYRLTPHVLIGMSKHHCQLIQAFTKDIPCRYAASLRCAYIFDTEKDPGISSEQKDKTILVLLSFELAEAVELLAILNEALAKIKNEDVRILIKGHPDYGSTRLIAAFGKKKWPGSFAIFHGSLPDALKQASIVISSNTTSMAEAAAKGIPVIFLGNQTALNHNMLAGLKMELVTECFSASELSVAIKKYCNSLPDKINDYKAMGCKVRDFFFTPVNDETLSIYINKNQLEKSTQRRY